MSQEILIFLLIIFFVAETSSFCYKLEAIYFIRSEEGKRVRKEEVIGRRVRLTHEGGGKKTRKRKEEDSFLQKIMIFDPLENECLP